MGGVIYSDSAIKATRFIMNCNQRKVPLVFLQDVQVALWWAAGLSMVALLKMALNGEHKPTVPNSWSWQSTEPAFAVMWQNYDHVWLWKRGNSTIAVMSGASAAKLCFKSRVTLKTKGKEINKKERPLIKDADRYNAQQSHSASRWNGVINPLKYGWISTSIET